QRRWKSSKTWRNFLLPKDDTQSVRNLERLVAFLLLLFLLRRAYGGRVLLLLLLLLLYSAEHPKRSRLRLGLRVGGSAARASQRTKPQSLGPQNGIDSRRS